jgi:hypothetical protein
LNHSELQVLTALSLISTIRRSQQHPLSLFTACCFFISRSLATASNSEDSLASRAQILLSVASCQVNYRAISSHPPLQSSTELPTLNYQLNCPGGPRYIASGRTQRKTPFVTILPLLGVVAETCLLSSCLAIVVSCGSTIPVFRRHVTILSHILDK